MIHERHIRLYKTEMCRNWQEIGHCRYQHKCRFAHGAEELRSIPRSSKYKTQTCRTFHLTGTCLYGVRCVFIHDETLILDEFQPWQEPLVGSPPPLYPDLPWFTGCSRRSSSFSSFSSLPL